MRDGLAHFSCPGAELRPVLSHRHATLFLSGSSLKVRSEFLERPERAVLQLDGTPAPNLSLAVAEDRVFLEVAHGFGEVTLTRATVLLRDSSYGCGWMKAGRESLGFE